MELRRRGINVYSQLPSSISCANVDVKTTLMHSGGSRMVFQLIHKGKKTRLELEPNCCTEGWRFLNRCTDDSFSAQRAIKSQTTDIVQTRFLIPTFCFVASPRVTLTKTSAQSTPTELSRQWLACWQQRIQRYGGRKWARGTGRVLSFSVLTHWTEFVCNRMI